MGGRYDLNPGKLLRDFESCSCGGELEFYDDYEHKRGYKSMDYEKRKHYKLHPLLKILIILVGGYLLLI